jgi:multiple sugar transport system ATP-binding protein
MGFGLKLRKFKKDEIKRRVEEAADILGIRDLLDRKPKALSGGQRQRVAVGRAIVRQPKVFLFDEPLSNLDAKLRVQMRAEISKLHNRLQATMIYVTHDQLEAMTMGDRIVVMKDGLIHQVAKPIELYDHPVNKFVAGFIGTPPMNFIEGRLERQNGASCFRTPSLSVRLPERMSAALAQYVNKEVVFGIRPEDVCAREQFPEIDKSRCVKARVEVIEPLGSESIWYLATPESSFIARVDSHTAAEVDRDKELVFLVDKAHIFDRETEQAIV